MSYDRTLLIFCERRKGLVMEKVGVKKTIDPLGRLSISKEMRVTLGIEKEVELVMTDEGILVKNPEYVLVKRLNAAEE